MSAVNCLSANAAIAMADGLLDPDTRSSWDGHLAQCGLCRELLAALVDEDRPQTLPPPVAGDQIGRYIVKERLGAGGFGLVYRAKDSKLGRDVALKIWRVDPLAGGSQGAALLLQEARSLAKLSHPNVMAIYDSGRDGERVFLAGELIEGTPLSAHVGEENGEQIAMWMLECANGLAAAHAVGLIHRDIKPDNIIIGEDGHARLVDFGLATSNRHSAQVSIPTGAVDTEAATMLPGLRETMLVGAQAGTPAYMAPEQLCGHAASKQSDQYSLCATFFEVANGCRVSSGQTFEELREFVLRKQTPTFRKGLPPRFVSATTRGLALEAEERWESVAGLSEKLVPLSRGHTTRYIVIAGVCAVAVAFLLIRGNEQAPRDCDALANAMDPVWSDARKQEIERAFTALGKGNVYSREAFELVDTRLTSYAADWRSQRVATCKATFDEERVSVSMFDRQMLCLDRRLGEMNHLVGLLLQADKALLDRAPRAIAQLTDLMICSDRERLGYLAPLPTNTAKLKKIQAVEAMLAEVEGLRMAGKYEEAIKLAQQAAEDAETVGYAPTVAQTSFVLGFVLSLGRDGERARKHLSDAHFGAVAAKDLRTSARAATELVFVYGNLVRDMERAEEWTHHAQSAVDAGGRKQQLVANLESYLGDLALQQGDSEAALRHNQLALELKTELHGKDDRGVAQSLNNLGQAHNLAGDYRKAVESYSEAHRIFGVTLGAHHPYVGLTAGNVGGILSQLGEYSEARERFEEAFVIATDADGAESYHAVQARMNLASALEAQGEREEAELVLAEIAAISEEHLGEETELRAQIANTRGVTATNQKKHQEALAFFEKAYSLHRKIRDENHPAVLLVEVNLAQTEANLERTKAALVRLRALVPRFEQVHGANHPMTAWVLMTRAEQYLNVRNAKAALEDLRTAEPVLTNRDVAPEQHLGFKFLLGQALWDMGDKSGANLVREAQVGYGELGEVDKNGVTDTKRWLNSHGLL